VPDVPPVRRRTALAGALGAVAATVLAAGCDHGDDIGGPTPTASPSTSTAPSSSAPARTSDESLVSATVEQLDSAIAVLVTARRFKALRQPLTLLLKAHRRHLEVLEGEPGGSTAPAPAGPAAALQAVHHSERQLQAALVDAAGRADSGALAKLLASMSASVAQFLVTLPPEVAT